MGNYSECEEKQLTESGEKSASGRNGEANDPVRS
jgi:hypothetical protein